ncbi:MAG TPA: hypothetical protein VMV10_04310 [Pirellulales bacterium]|nr:hypothetical protein [Pirellulales bacterium]
MSWSHPAYERILQRRGDLRGARRAYRNVRTLCEAGPKDGRVLPPNADDTDRLAEAAAERIAELDAIQEPER